MGLEFDIVPKRGITYFKFSGDTDVAEGATTFVEYVNAPSFDTSFIMLTNARDVGEISAGFMSIVMAIERLAPNFRKFQKPGLSVIYAPDDVSYGMGRMLQQIAEPISKIEFQITRCARQALQAANQPEADFETFEVNTFGAGFPYDHPPRVYAG